MLSAKIKDSTLRVFSAILLCCAVPPLGATEAVVFDYAQNLQIESFATHRLITVINVNRDSDDRFTYALVPKGQSIPKLPANTTIIRTPVERVVVMATTFIGYIDKLNQLESLIGVATPDFINNETVHQRIRSGQIQTVQAGPGLDVERLLLLEPDLILSSSSGASHQDSHPLLVRSGLPVVLSASYMEQHPLARAEWLKFVAAFFDVDAQAEQIFNEITERYQKLAARASVVTEKPTVFCGTPYAGTWHVPGGQSYVAKTLDDAGANYLWSEDDSRGGIPLDFERVFFTAAHASFWINLDSYKSLDSLFEADHRFNHFRAAQAGHVYNNSKQFKSNGGNAIWERGIVHPDEVLADLIKIFHPELAKDHRFIYYEQLQ